MMEALDISEYDAKDLTGLDELVATQKPFVVRGLINHWPLKKMGEGSFERLSEYLLSHSEARKMVTHIGNYSSAEHIGYNECMEMNFRTEELDLNSVLERIKHSYTGDTNELVYVSSVEIKKYFRNLGDENNVDLGDRETRAGIWIGSKNTVPTHFDFPDNLACVAVGKRKFTLFPPEQTRNLYPGPLDNTPAGRSISLVDAENPDYEKFPDYIDAQSVSASVELEAGDAIHIPSMWWHSVKATSDFNILVNYWWRDNSFSGEPDAALIHAILAIRDLPEHKKKIWSDMFSHYVFDCTSETFDYIPEDAKGILAPLTPGLAARIRNFLRHVIN